MAGAVVELERIAKTFGDVRTKRGEAPTPVVRDVSLQIAAGEFLVLVGPSGCGKSTLLRIIAGLETPTSGLVKIDGRVVNDTPPKDRDIGMVFQSYALYPHMRVRDNLAFGLVLRGAPKPEIATRVAEAAKTLALDGLLHRYPKELSGGQRQRVAIGRAIVREPKVFLFDEPLSNLDAALRVQMRAELGALHRRLGTTMVYVTHDQVEAMTLATRIAVLHRGVLQQVGTPLDLYEHPANRFVAGFIGSPAMSFLDGEIVERGAGPTFALSGAGVPARLPLGPAAVGLRPQAMRLAAPEAGMVRGTVEVVEPMGWETFVHVATDGDEAATRLVVHCAGAPPFGLRAGDPVGVSFELGRAHLFGADGALLKPQRAAG
jgi:ABC-type sugar transport system ATPase subunit